MYPFVRDTTYKKHLGITFDCNHLACLFNRASCAAVAFDDNSAGVVLEEREVARRERKERRRMGT